MGFKTTLAIIIIAYLLIVSIAFASIMTYRLHFPQHANVMQETQIKAYLDPSATQELINGTLIDWGNVALGMNTKTYWIKNVGNNDLNLTLTYQNLPTNWNLSWNYDGTTLTPQEIRQITVTLTVPNTANEGSYDWNSWIEANQT